MKLLPRDQNYWHLMENGERMKTRKPKMGTEKVTAIYLSWKTQMVIILAHILKKLTPFQD